VAITPAVTVPAPEPYGRRYGLLTAAAGPLDLPVNRFGGGVQYDPVSCGTARRVPMDCVDQDSPVTKTFDPGDDWVEGLPFVVYATLQCGSAGAGDVEERVRRRLANGTQSAVEAELGERLTADATAVPAPVTTEASSVVGELEQWLYGDMAYGNVGFIHASFRMASYLHKGTLLSTDSAGRFRTRMGTVVVFGNYPDDGGVFITGHTTLWRAPDVAVSPRAQVLDRTNNNLYMLAEQEWAVAYDCVAGRSTYTLEGMS
jgi:hypothetical protein